MQIDDRFRLGTPSRSMLSLGVVVIVVAIVATFMILKPSDPSREAIGKRVRAEAIDRQCRQTCSAWLAPQCDAQKPGARESIVECASRLAPVFEGCLNQCRGQ
jgi:hypothetical protein